MSDKTLVITCPCCYGQDVITLNDDQYRCKSCNNTFFLESDSKVRNALQTIVNQRQIMNFDEAEELIEQFISSNKKNAEGYFQKILVEYGVTYVKDYDEITLKPTISRASTKKITSLDSYKKLLENSKNDFIKEDYINKIEEIENIREEIIAKAKKQEQYDIFICYKRTDNDLLTQDSHIAKKIYDSLDKQGYKVFLAEETLTSGEEYEPVIYNALMSAKVMLVIAASKKEYLTAPWVKNEWQRFIKFVENDETKALIPVTANGFEPYDLPSKLGKFQAINYDAEFNEKLNAVLQKRISFSLKSKLNKKNIEVQKIKPIEVQEVKISKRSFNGNQNTIVLQASEETKLVDAREFLSQGRKKEAEYYAQEVLKYSPNHAEAAWIYFSTDRSLKKLDYLRVALENDEKEFLNRLSTVEEDLYEQAKIGKINSILYNLYVEYLPEEFEIPFISKLNELYFYYLDSLKNKDIKQIDEYEEMVYPLLTKLGAKGLINHYNTLALKLDEKQARKYYDKSLEIFKYDPVALWNSSSRFIGQCKDTRAEAIKRMIEGGYKVNIQKGNIFNIALESSYYDINRHQFDKGIYLFNELYAMIPEDIDTVKVLLKFGDLLLLNGQFDKARFYYEEVIGKDPVNLQAHLGLFKINVKARTNYDLLLLPKSFVEYREHYNSLREIETQLKSNDFSNFSKLHDRILSEKKWNKHIKLLSAYEVRYCNASKSLDKITYEDVTKKDERDEQIRLSYGIGTFLAQVIAYALVFFFVLDLVTGAAFITEPKGPPMNFLGGAIGLAVAITIIVILVKNFGGSVFIGFALMFGGMFGLMVLFSWLASLGYIPLTKALENSILGPEDIIYIYLILMIASYVIIYLIKKIRVLKLKMYSTTGAKWMVIALTAIVILFTVIMILFL